MKLKSIFSKNIVLLLLLMTSCGKISTQGSSSYNDPRPNGTVVSQGQLFSQNGNPAISGSSIIFNTQSQSYILRIEGLSLTWETGLNIQVFESNSSSPVTTAQLRGASGNQNYSFSSATNSFTSVCIYSTRNQKNYACSQLHSN